MGHVWSAWGPNPEEGQMVFGIEDRTPINMRKEGLTEAGEQPPTLQLHALSRHRSPHLNTPARLTRHPLRHCWTERVRGTKITSIAGNSFHWFQTTATNKTDKRRNNTANASFKHPTSGKRRRRVNFREFTCPTTNSSGGTFSTIESQQPAGRGRSTGRLECRDAQIPPHCQPRVETVEILIPRDITDPSNLNSG
ncbi:7SK snRNA methylphosphate capping enzyme isoform X1 [Lates japonicus]|uniref:7SK snRNA methylphosphate capping enzyme isoform X1 n=1 Tax=Lates japonicus TaxID=270547 RepID=A0AAD3M3L0_LATJO|nr:7SK snRNA methylphosphate capping enzyme isoform X1 [Lates japonicus]